MAHLRLRFYAELNDFLERNQRGGAVATTVLGRPSIKDVIESVGVPHTEVDLILVNGESVPFEYQVADGDQISVYPAFRSLPLIGPHALQPHRPQEARFALDIHLGQLANYLRMLGFDSRYRNDFEDKELARLSSEQDRILLTRDRELLKRRRIRRGYYLRSTTPRDQVVEVIRRFDLLGEIDPFQRCIDCNGTLEWVEGDQVEGQVPPVAWRQFREFRKCRGCGKVYWEGSHVERMQSFIEWIEGQFT